MILANVRNPRETWYVHWLSPAGGIVWGKDPERSQVFNLPMDHATMRKLIAMEQDKHSGVTWQFRIYNYPSAGQLTAWEKHIIEHVAELRRDGRLLPAPAHAARDLPTPQDR